MTDAQVTKIVTHRSGKAPPPKMLQPVGRFANIQQAKDFFNNARQKNIDFVQLTNENLRNRYW